MSRVVKNSRRCSPRAKWKIEAPCMIVLSTSKNAAAVGSSGRSPSGVLDLRRGGRGLAGERRAPLQVAAPCGALRVSGPRHGLTGPEPVDQDAADVWIDSAA